VSSAPYRAPPGTVVDVKVLVALGDNQVEGAERSLARLLREGYELVAHSGCCTDTGSLRLSWTCVKASSDERAPAGPPLPVPSAGKSRS